MGDINGDGKIDLLIPEYVSPSTLAWKRLTYVIFDIPLNTQGETEMNATAIGRVDAQVATNILVGDINGDGFADLIKAEPDYDGAQLDRYFLEYRITGLQDEFQYHDDIPSNTSIILEDIDFDGRLDLVFGNTLLWRGLEAVSYTHLTLPTIYSV